jgi:hypothetical protein
MPKVYQSMLLSTDDDFGIILEALDSFVQHTINLSTAIEMTSVAIQEANRLDPNEVVNDKDFAKTVAKGMNMAKVKDKSVSIRDKIIILKAKVVMTKEYLRGATLEREIDTLTD